MLQRVQPGQKGKVTSAPSQAGGHNEVRFVLCFVRANSLKNPKHLFREGCALCQETSQIPVI